jgi:hypothetical protein
VALTPDSEQSHADKLAARRAAEQEVLQREVDEAVRQDQLGSIAKRYGTLIIAAVVLAIAAFGGWLLWNDSRENQLEERSEKLVTVLDKLEGGQIPQAQADLNALAADGSSATAVSAKLAQAAIALNQNRRADAVKALDQVAADDDAPQAYRDLAAIRSVAAQFEDLQPQSVIDRLKPLATPGNPWFGSAGELVAMAYLKQGKENLAGPLLAEIAQDEQVPQTLRARTRQLAGVLGYDAVVDVDQTLREMREETGAARGAAAAQAPAPAPAAQ